MGSDEFSGDSRPNVATERRIPAGQDPSTYKPFGKVVEKKPTIEENFVVDIRSTIALIVKGAEQARLSAGYNGEHHDGGCAATLREVEIYQDGLATRVPKGWKETYEKVKAAREFEEKKIANPGDYAEYLRLKELFEK